MATSCARCGDADPEARVELPDQWIDYLTDVRGVDRPAGDAALPLCHPCRGAVTFLVEYERVMDPSLGERARRVFDRRREFLDEFDAARFVDTGS